MGEIPVFQDKAMLQRIDDTGVWLRGESMMWRTWRDDFSVCDRWGNTLLLWLHSIKWTTYKLFIYFGHCELWVTSNKQWKPNNILWPRSVPTYWSTLVWTEQEEKKNWDIPRSSRRMFSGFKSLPKKNILQSHNSDIVLV